MIDFEALFKISYGLYIVSAGDEKSGNGYISNSVFQVTSEPPQFAVCCNKDNYSAGFIQKYKGFTISVLKQDATSDLIAKFGYKSGKVSDKLQGTKKISGESGAPVILDDTIAWLECKLKQTFDVGTHLIFVGELIQAQVVEKDAEPLTYAYYRKVKKGMAPKNAPTFIDKSKLMNKPGTAKLARYQCPACGYIYDPAIGDPVTNIKPGIAFEDLPDNWVCPVCGTEKDDFIKMDN
jgi:flavin reductase (DIM6/NTAB) family NADH-FMN oxidoreductase RutF/rubredoxin